MGATTSATVVTTASTTSAVRTVSKPSMDSSSSTASEYEPSSNEGEDDEPEVVEVTPSKNSKKRKPTTLDLSESPPLVRRKTTETLNTKTARNQLAGKLKEIRAIPTAGYTVMMHKELASFVKKVFAADKLNNWEPRDDVKLAQLLNEMKKRMGVFKDSVAQTLRWKAIEEWQKEMTGASFVPTLDLTSTPPKMDPRVAFTNVSSCQTYNELKVFAKPLVRISSEMGADASNTNEMRQKYFQPLLGATNKYLAAVTATKDQTIQNKGITQCIRSLKMICLLADGANITQKECVQLEEMLYLIRLIMHKNGNFRKIIMTVTIDLLTLFPPSSRPDFNYPTKKKKKKTKHKST